MEQEVYIKKIWLISNKKWSGFSCIYSDKWFKFKARSYETISFIVFFLQFFQRTSFYLTKGDFSDLVLAILTGGLLLIIIYQSFFGKKTSNRIEYDYNRKVLTISSRNLIRRIFKWSFDVKTSEIESISSVVHKNLTRINITIAGEEHMLLDIRNRKGDGSETIDSKTDGEIVVTCLEKIFETN